MLSKDCLKVDKVVRPEINLLFRDPALHHLLLVFSLLAAGQLKLGDWRPSRGVARLRYLLLESRSKGQDSGAMQQQVEHGDYCKVLLQYYCVAQAGHGEK